LCHCREAAEAAAELLSPLQAEEHLIGSGFAWPSLTFDNVAFGLIIGATLMLVVLALTAARTGGAGGAGGMRDSDLDTNMCEAPHLIGQAPGAAPLEAAVGCGGIPIMDNFTLSRHAQPTK
jgi:hypothetical protein